MEEKEERKFDW